MEGGDDVRTLFWRELQVVAARLVAEIPVDTEKAMTNAEPVFTNSYGTARVGRHARPSGRTPALPREVLEAAGPAARSLLP